jgi:hypothetical protein
MMDPRRITLTLGTAVSVAFAAVIGLAPAARADTEPDPFEDLLGTAGVNTWTPTADTELLSSNPTEAANLDASIETFNNDVGLAYQIDPLSQLAFEFDPSGFTQGGFTGIDPASGGLPDTAFTDLAVGQRPDGSGLGPDRHRADPRGHRDRSAVPASPPLRTRRRLVIDIARQRFEALRAAETR